MGAKRGKQFVLDRKPVPDKEYRSRVDVVGSGYGPCTGHADVDSMVFAYCGEREDWDRRTQQQLRELTHEEPLSVCWPYSRNAEMPPKGEGRGFRQTWKPWTDRTHWEGDDMVYLKRMSLEELRAVTVKRKSKYREVLEEFVASGYISAEVDVSQLPNVKTASVRNLLETQTRRPEFGHIRVMERQGRVFLVDKNAEL